MQPGDRHRLDSPPGVLFLVSLVVVAEPVHVLEWPALRPPELVFERPDPDRGCGRRQSELRHVAVVDGDHILDGGAEERDVVRDGMGHAPALPRDVDLDIVGEDLGEPIPVLRVHHPEVARLELPDVLDVVSHRPTLCHRQKAPSHSQCGRGRRRRRAHALVRRGRGRTAPGLPSP